MVLQTILPDNTDMARAKIPLSRLQFLKTRRERELRHLKMAGSETFENGLNNLPEGINFW
jgi:hypothetical protein